MGIAFIAIAASAISLVVYSVYTIVYRLYFHPLAKFPGNLISLINALE